MDASGLWDPGDNDEVDEPDAGLGGCRRPQLVGTPERSTLDLKPARRDGRRKLLGRWAAVRDGPGANFSGGLRNVFRRSRTSR